MSDVVYLRPLDPPVTPDDVKQMAAHAGACFDLHRVDWMQSFLSTEGTRMLCWYRAPDAESVRIALRQLGSDIRAAWPARRIGPSAAEAGPTRLTAANVVAEFCFDAPGDASTASLQAAADGAVLGRHAVEFLGGFVSTAGQRAACVYRAADADAVRTALAAGEVTPAAVWGCTALTPR